MCELSLGGSNQRPCVNNVSLRNPTRVAFAEPSFRLFTASASAPQGVVLMQLACPPLRHEEQLSRFRAELRACDNSLTTWRASASLLVKEAAGVLDHSDGAPPAEPCEALRT
jgi:hypothetical protein